MEYTYTSIRAAMQNFSENDDSEYDDSMDDFLEKAETRVLRELDLEMFENWSSIEISGSDRIVTRPTDSVVVNSVWIRLPSTLSWFELPRRKFEYCLMYAPVEGTTGVPMYYSEYDADSIYVVPTPDQTYSTSNARARCTIRPTKLSATNESSYLGTYLGDLLFQACMLEAYSFLKHPAKLQETATLYQSLMEGVEKEYEEVVRPQYKALAADSEPKGAND